MSGSEAIKDFFFTHRSGLSIVGVSILLGLFPLFEENPYILGITNQIAIHLMIVLGLNLFTGYAGQISLGHAGFFGLGAYGSAIFSTTVGLSPWISMFIVATLVALTALIIGVPALRLSGHYLAMATLGFNLVIYTIFIQWDSVTGGPSGFSGIPTLSVWNFQFDSDIAFHYLLWGVALVFLTFALNLVRSPVGRGLSALAKDETAAQTFGIDTQRSKINVFVLSAVFASIAGSLFAHYFTFVSPDSFTIFVSLDLVIMVIVGGMGSVWGSLFGAGVITALPEFLDLFEIYKDIIYGSVLVLILLFLPEGLPIGLVERIKTIANSTHKKNNA